MATVVDDVLTVDEARRITAPIFEALNRPSEKDVSALLTQACHDDYRSYYTNEEFWTLDQFAGAIKAMGTAVPDLTWEVLELHVSGDQIFARGLVSGTPVAEFYGAAPTGKTFRTMTMEILTVRDGKLTKAYHVENWKAAIEQLAA